MLKGVYKEGYVYPIDHNTKHVIANNYDWHLYTTQEVEFEFLYGGAFIKKLGRIYEPEEVEEFFSKRNPE